MLATPPDSDSRFAEVSPAIVGARAVGVDVNETVVVDQKAVVVQSRRYGSSADVGLGTFGRWKERTTC